jgi:monothiol glutaredoxin
MALEESLRNRISELITKDRVVLFMKGTRNFPQCGFSATVVQILNELVPKYETVNVLKEPEIREGIKHFSNWPTIPQLYVEGKFVGGCDIVREMYVAGELQGLLGVQDDSKPPRIRITEAAQRALREAGQGESGTLRLGVSSRFEYELALDETHPGDFEIDAGGITVLVDRMSSKRADGITIDYSSAGGGGFRIDNPNEPPRVRPLTPTDLKRMLDAGEKPVLVDVRTEREHAIANIGDAELLEDIADKLESLDRDTPLVFFCHHGPRSQNAAEGFVREGYKRVYNLEGGIDAWSREVDASVPKY